MHALDAAFDCAAHDELGAGGAVVGAGALVFLGAAVEFLARGTNRGDALAEFRLFVVLLSERVCMGRVQRLLGLCSRHVSQALERQRNNAR